MIDLCRFSFSPPIFWVLLVTAPSSALSGSDAPFNLKKEGINGSIDHLGSAGILRGGKTLFLKNTL
jgi:hypothetical protein